MKESKERPESGDALESTQISHCLQASDLGDAGEPAPFTESNTSWPENPILMEILWEMQALGADVPQQGEPAHQ